MWVCPKCGREFQRTNQGHYCGEAPKTVAEYIESQPVESRPHLTQLASIIRGSAAGVSEGISWSMPTYDRAGKSVSFAACKNHVSLYVGVEAIGHFASELSRFQPRKSAIYLPYNRALPQELLEGIVKWCLA